MDWRRRGGRRNRVVGRAGRGGGLSQTPTTTDTCLRAPAYPGVEHTVIEHTLHCVSAEVVVFGGDASIAVHIAGECSDLPDAPRKQAAAGEKGIGRVGKREVQRLNRALKSYWERELKAERHRPKLHEATDKFINLIDATATEMVGGYDDVRALGADLGPPACDQALTDGEMAVTQGRLARHDLGELDAAAKDLP